MITPFAPLDQFHPFVDDLGKITPEWYSWLKQLCDELNRLRDIEARVAKARSTPGYGGVDG